MRYSIRATTSKCGERNLSFDASAIRTFYRFSPATFGPDIKTRNRARSSYSHLFRRPHSSGLMTGRVRVWKTRASALGRETLSDGKLTTRRRPDRFLRRARHVDDRTRHTDGPRQTNAGDVCAEAHRRTDGHARRTSCLPPLPPTP